MHLYVKTTCTYIHLNNTVIEICFETPPLQRKVSKQDTSLKKSTKEMYFPSFQSTKRKHMKEEFFSTVYFADMHAFCFQKINKKRWKRKPMKCVIKPCTLQKRMYGNRSRVNKVRFLSMICSKLHRSILLQLLQNKLFTCTFSLLLDKYLYLDSQALPFFEKKKKKIIVYLTCLEI